MNNINLNKLKYRIYEVALFPCDHCKNYNRENNRKCHDVVCQDFEVDDETIKDLIQSYKK